MCAFIGWLFYASAVDAFNSKNVKPNYNPLYWLEVALVGGLLAFFMILLYGDKK